MAQRDLHEIVVHPRTIDIAGDILAIAEIARMRVLEYQEIRGFGTGSRILVNLSLGAFFFGLVVLVLNGRSSLGNTLAVVGALAAVAVAIYASTGPWRRNLVIEMSSGGRSVLGAGYVEPLEQLKSTIAMVIENPPSQPQVVQVANIHTVDLRNSRGVQVGDGNTQRNLGL